MSNINLLDEVGPRIDNTIVDHETGLVTFLNPFSYYQCRKSPDAIRQFDHIYIDGMLLVRLLNLVFPRKFTRISFDMTSAAPVLFERWSQNGKRVYFVGSTPDAIEGFVRTIGAAYPALKIDGYRNGYFKGDERAALIRELAERKPDVIVVGMGTPLQEQLLLDIRQAGWQGCGYTCGGFIHQTSGKTQYYPKILDKLNLRWMYRIYDEPKLFKRYALYYPLAVMQFLLDAMRRRNRAS